MRMVSEGQSSLDLKIVTERAIKMVNLLDHEFYARSDAKELNEMIFDRLTLLTQLGEIKNENGLVKISGPLNKLVEVKGSTPTKTGFSYI